MITALSTTIFGSLGAYAMTTVSIFFIAGNFLAPLLNTIFGHNMAFLMFGVSIVYTVFAFAVTFITYSQQIALFDSFVIRTVFLLASSVVGLAGGAIWIGYGVLNIQLGEHIPKKLLADHLANHLLDEEEDKEVLLTKLQEAVTGKIMSIGWSLLSLNTVFGGILTYVILQLSSGSESSPDHTPGPDSHVLTLFIILSLISVLANVSYFVLYRYYTNDMMTNGESNGRVIFNGDDNGDGIDVMLIEKQQKTSQRFSPSAGPITLGSSPALIAQPAPPNTQNGDDSETGEASRLLLNAKFQQQLDEEKRRKSKTIITTTTSQHYGSHDESNPLLSSNGSSTNSCNGDDNHTLHTSITTTTTTRTSDEYLIDGSHCHDSHLQLTQWEIFIALIKSSYMLLSIPQYLFAGCAMNYLYALFIPVIVKPVLGLTMVPLIITMTYLTNTIASYFIGDYINTRMNARMMAIGGNVIQVLPIFLPLIITIGGSDGTSSSFDAWLFIILISSLAGIGDAIHSSSLMTVMASDLKHDHGLGGSRFAKVSPLVEKELKEILYSCYSSIKSIGIFLTFLLSGVMLDFDNNTDPALFLPAYEKACLVLFVLGAMSVIGQIQLRKCILEQVPL